MLLDLYSPGHVGYLQISTQNNILQVLCQVKGTFMEIFIGGSTAQTADHRAIGELGLPQWYLHPSRALGAEMSEKVGKDGIHFVQLRLDFLSDRGCDSGGRNCALDPPGISFLLLSEINPPERLPLVQYSAICHTSMAKQPDEWCTGGKVPSRIVIRGY
jgi:hypothetical protein